MNKRIYNYSIHLLARQDYSEFKLKQKLRSKKDNLPHEVDEVIAELKVKGLLKEESYRRLFIRKWMMKGESEEKIKKRGGMEKLKFEEEEFRAIEIELGFNDDDSIDKLISKKLRAKVIPTQWEEKNKLRDKVLRFLISKGHSFSDSRDALNKFFKGATSPDFD